MSELNRDPTPTTQTKIHKRLHDTIWLMGFDVEDETAVGKYSLDCYVRELHCGFEADGHNYHRGKRQRSRDAARDSWILANAGIPILRVPDTMLSSAHNPALIEDINQFINKYADSAELRRAVSDAIGGV